jgi:hypothetical protein
VQAQGALRWLRISVAFLLLLIIAFVPVLFLLARTPLHGGEELPGTLLLTATVLVSAAVALLCMLRNVRFIAGAAALYSVAALAFWTFFSAPSAGIHQLPLAIVALVAVLIPYAFLIFVHRRSVDPLSQGATTFASIAVALIALWAYWPAFQSYDVPATDGEYGLVFWVAPGVQVLLVLGALAFALSRRRFSKGKPIVHDHAA